MKALVVFSNGGGDHPLARLLKPGFGHCFAALNLDGYWLRIDGRRGVPEFQVLTLGDFDLAGFYREHGYTVVETEQRDRPLTSPLVFRNCVGLVVAILCLRTWAITPYRLFKFLTRKPMQLLPGFDSPAPPAAPPPPPSQTDPATQQAITDAQTKLRLSEKTRKGRAATLLAPIQQSGLGDTNLNRPAARSAQLLGD